MIRASDTIRHEALFRVESENCYKAHPVIAWDDEGYALILDSADGRLIRASSASQNFFGVRPVEGVGHRYLDRDYNEMVPDGATEMRTPGANSTSG